MILFKTKCSERGDVWKQKVSFTPVSEGTNRKLSIPPTSRSCRKGLNPIRCTEGQRRANLPEQHRGFIRELVCCILFERRMRHFELPAGVKVIGWIEMFSHPYQAQADNAAILLASSALRSTLISLQQVLMGA